MTQTEQALTAVVELDCPNWPPDTLDLEPEQCWCLRCGDALPCECAATMNTTKELASHV